MAKPLTIADRGAKAVACLPETLRVGHLDFAIIKWPTIESHASARFGEFSALEQCIRIREDMPSPAKTVETLLHEILHAVWWLFDLERQEGEEHVVNHFGTGLTQVHRDNPWLATWIAEHTR